MLFLFYLVGETIFKVNLNRYDSSFTNEETSGKSRLGETLYFKADLNTKRSDIMMHPQQCYAKSKSGSAKYMLVVDRYLCTTIYHVKT